MNWFAKSVLFVSSYAPLLALFWLLNSLGSAWSTVAGLAAVVSTVSLAGVWILLTRFSSRDVITFSGARNRDSEVMAYVVTYVVPFAAAASTMESGGRWALVLFACLIGALYIRSNIFYVHPLLLMVGIHVYEVSRQGVPCVLLTRRGYVRQVEQLPVVEIASNVFVERRGQA